MSRLTSSAWDIKTKERHWWRHNWDSDHRLLSLPLRYDRVTLCLYGDSGQIIVIAGILKLRKRFRMSQILFEHGLNSLPLVCFRENGNLSTLSIAIPRLAFWVTNDIYEYICVCANIKICTIHIYTQYPYRCTAYTMQQLKAFSRETVPHLQR